MYVIDSFAEVRQLTSTNVHSQHKLLTNKHSLSNVVLMVSVLGPLLSSLHHHVRTYKTCLREFTVVPTLPCGRCTAQEKIEHMAARTKRNMTIYV